MNNVRCGERATFAGLLVLSAGALCVALTACSSGSDTGGALGGWGGTASSNGNGAGGSTDPTGGNAGSGGGSGGGGVSGGSDASTPAADAGRASRDGGAEAAVEAGPVEDAGSSANTFSLVNTNVNTIVYGETIYGYDPIAENAVLDLNKVGTALSIRANPTPMIVDHIDFVMDGTYTHTEHAAPYFLCGDNGNGTITPCTQLFTNGAHMLTITVYALGSDAGPDGGTPLSSSTLYFSVSDSDAGAPDGGPG